MLYRNRGTGEVYDSGGGRDERLESVAGDLWVPVNLAEAAAPFEVWSPPPLPDPPVVDAPSPETDVTL